jgi:hypothetical protein
MSRTYHEFINLYTDFIEGEGCYRIELRKYIHSFLESELRTYRKYSKLSDKGMVTSWNYDRIMTTKRQRAIRKELRYLFLFKNYNYILFNLNNNDDIYGTDIVQSAVKFITKGLL